MDQFKLVETVKQTETDFVGLLYMSYKKVLIVSARDFIYVKHYRKVNEDKWCEIAKSIEH